MDHPELHWTAVAPEYEAWSGGIVRAHSLRSDCQIAIIGAGPYGLAAAAHLRSAGVRALVFGETMSFWRKHMPKGMLMRSPWRGNHIADPERRLTLDEFARQTGARATDPMPLETFVRYGEWVQRQAAPDLVTRKVASLAPSGAGFCLTLEDGEIIHSGRVVVATGLARQEVRPKLFGNLPPGMVSHSSEHTGLERFRGMRVAVIGRGQNACEICVLLHEAGADVEMISRGGIDWTGSETPGGGGGLRGAMLRHLRPPSPIGPFPLNWLIQEPGVYRRMPEFARATVSNLSLRPSAAAWLRPRTQGIRMSFGRSVASVRLTGRAAQLQLDNGASSEADHVVLATGYHSDISRSGILTADVLNQVKQEDGSPLLNRDSESSLRGLHFVGSAAIHTFGPIMRSVYGAGHAARALTRAARRN